MRRRRSRVRWVVKWAATVACGLTLAAMAACLYRRSIYLFFERLAFFLEGGRLEVSLPTDGDVFRWPSYWVFETVEFEDWNDVLRSLLVFVEWPIGYAVQGGYQIRIPLWIPLLFFGALTSWLWRADRRRIGPGCCLKYGYDLTGNVSGRCPECGAAVEAKTGAGG